eukprot:UN04730
MSFQRHTVKLERNFLPTSVRFAKIRVTSHCHHIYIGKTSLSSQSYISG